MNITDFGNLAPSRPEPTPEQYAAARRYLEQHAPDLLAMIGLAGEAS